VNKHLDSNSFFVRRLSRTDQAEALDKFFTNKLAQALQQLCTKTDDEILVARLLEGGKRAEE